MKVILRNDISSPLDTSLNQAQPSQMTKCSRDLGLLIDSQQAMIFPALYATRKFIFPSRGPVFWAR
jgi:hypothetical protein